jgi:hypothetical protein
MTIKNDVKERLHDRTRAQYLARTKVHSNTTEHSTLFLTGNVSLMSIGEKDRWIRGGLDTLVVSQMPVDEMERLEKLEYLDLEMFTKVATATRMVK